MSTINLHNVECLEFMKGMEDNSVDAIVTDPPYFGVKDEDWDNQWKNEAHFIEWIGELCVEWKRILRPNGSLYCFASPRMAARVEVKIGEFLSVLSSVVWAKPEPTSEINRGAGNGGRVSKDSLRSFYPNTERIIFAEHFGADNIAKGEAGYIAKCDDLRGFVFEPLRAYLDGERERAGWSVRQVAEAYQKVTGSRTVTGMAGHWFGQVQWALPTAANYAWLREIFAGDYLRREYEDLRREYEDLRREYEDLRREYEDLRREYEDLRRPFNVTADVPYTDVWTFRTVQAYEGKHVCEKPLALMEHIILASTRPDALVFDPFAGSGSTGIAAVLNGRRFLGCEKDPAHYRNALQRIKKAQSAPRLFAPEPVQLNLQTSIEDAE